MVKIEYTRVNEEISAQVVFLIDENNTPLGQVSRDQALVLAFDKQIDLVEVSAKATPPVVRLIDRGKYQYELAKKEAKQKLKQKGGELKEVRLSLKIDNHDLETKARRSRDFLVDGNKVKVIVIMKGRENMFPDRAVNIINKFTEIIGGKIDYPPVRMGNRFNATIIKDNSKDNNAQN